jgi:hypothetical protein
MYAVIGYCNDRTPDAFLISWLRATELELCRSQARPGAFFSRRALIGYVDCNYYYEKLFANPRVAAE